MGAELWKSSGLSDTHSAPVEPAKDKPKGNQELFLCLALILLMAWAFLFSVHAVDWVSISHAFKSILTAIL
jgi:hypothetical protein